MRGAADAVASPTPPTTPAKPSTGGSKITSPSPSPLKRASTFAKPSTPSKLRGTPTRANSTPTKIANSSPTPSALPAVFPFVLPKAQETPKKDGKKTEDEKRRAEEKKKDDERKKKEDEKKKQAASDKAVAPARGGLFALPRAALPFLQRAAAAPPPEATALQRISAQVPLWLLAATDAVCALTEDNPDVLTAVAAALVALGGVATGGSAAVAAIGEVAVVVGHAIKTVKERHAGHGHGHGH